MKEIYTACSKKSLNYKNFEKKISRYFAETISGLQFSRKGISFMNIWPN